MSCLLKEFASINDFSELVGWLCPHLKDKFPDSDFSTDCPEWNDNWNENEFEEQKCQDETKDGWMEDCIIGISPIIDLMAIASRNRLSILTSRREKTEKGDKRYIFSVNWKGIISTEVEWDEVQSILCLPIISQKQSSSGAPDWTCVIVGFKSGFISIYTESGLMLLSQVFEEKPVKDLTVRTYVPKNFGACVYADLNEELLILYPKSVVSIDGFSLLQTLKACRNQVAKATATGAGIPSVASLGYKKWSLSEQDIVSGCVGSGMIPPHLYDHVMAMSSIHGFNQSFSGGVPTTSLLLTVGRVPYFASYSIREGFAQPFIADIAVHYASKLKNALVSAASGWLFGNKSNQEGTKVERKIEQPVQIPFRYTLPDKRRVGLSLQMASNRRLATVTDDFGRVSVLDIQKNYAVRLFKGYRDAECGWVNVYDDLRDPKKEVPYLVIYAPRRSLLEVWLPQQGPRVAAFNVPKKSRLLYTPYSLLGANTQQGCIFPTTPVVLVNFQGKLERLSIPFHVTLSLKTNKHARDVYVLKSIKASLLKRQSEEVLALVKEIKTTPMKIQLVNLIIESKYLTLDLVQEVLKVLSEEESSDQGRKEKEMKDQESILKQQILRLNQLLRMFKYILPLHDLSHDPTRLPEDDEVRKKLTGYLKVSEKEEDQLSHGFLHPKLISNKPKTVSFLKEEFSFREFLQCWELSTGSFEKEFKDVFPVFLKKKLSDEQLTDLGKFLFGWVFRSNCWNTFSECIRSSGASVADLLHLSFLNWFANNRIDTLTTLCFFHHLVILTIFSVLGPTNLPSYVTKLSEYHPSEEPPIISDDLSEVKPLWSEMRDKIVTWNKPFHAFVAALICRGIETNLMIHAHKLKKELEEEFANPEKVIEKFLLELDFSHRNSASDTSQMEWEEFSMEIVEWNILSKKLNSLISAQKLFNLLCLREGAKHNSSDLPEYSVKTLSLKGKGYLSELIAKWFILSKIPISTTVTLIKCSNSEETVDSEENSTATSEPESIEQSSYDFEDLSEADKDVLEQLKNLQRNFPESTKSDILLVNLSWEFAAAWKKFPNDLTLYESAVYSLKSISSAFFKHGLSYMMWETWIVHFVHLSAQLMEKVCRRPKDRLSMKDIGISEFSLDKFFSLTKDLLECMATENAACQVERPPIVGKDEFWKEIDTTASLPEVTVAQKRTSADLIFLHYQLLSVLSLIVKYDLKNVKPYSLFPERDRASFFKPLISNWRSTSEEGREVMSSGQLLFLTRVVSAAVINLPDCGNDSNVPTPSGLKDALEIGHSWGVSLDTIRRHYVCELYRSGLDSMADQALIMVRDAVMIGSQMIIIAGQRLRYLITTSPRSIEIIALMTPHVKEWCMKLDPDGLRCPDVPVKETVKMVNKALNFIPETNRDYKAALSLTTAFNMIHDSSVFPD